MLLFFSSRSFSVCAEQRALRREVVCLGEIPAGAADVEDPLLGGDRTSGDVADEDARPGRKGVDLRVGEGRSARMRLPRREVERGRRARLVAGELPERAPVAPQDGGGGRGVLVFVPELHRRAPGDLRPVADFGALFARAVRECVDCRGGVVVVAGDVPGGAPGPDDVGFRGGGGRGAGTYIDINPMSFS